MVWGVRTEYTFPTVGWRDLVSTSVVEKSVAGPTLPYSILSLPC